MDKANGELEKGAEVGKACGLDSCPNCGDGASLTVLEAIREYPYPHRKQGGTLDPFYQAIVRFIPKTLVLGKLGFDEVKAIIAQVRSMAPTKASSLFGEDDSPSLIAIHFLVGTRDENWCWCLWDVPRIRALEDYLRMEDAVAHTARELEDMRMLHESVQQDLDGSIEVLKQHHDWPLFERVSPRIRELSARHCSSCEGAPCICFGRVDGGAS